LPFSQVNLTEMIFFSAANNPFNRLKGAKLGAILQGMHPRKQLDLAYNSEPAKVRTAELLALCILLSASCSLHFAQLSLLLPRTLA